MCQTIKLHSGSKDSDAFSQVSILEWEQKQRFLFQLSLVQL